MRYAEKALYLAGIVLTAIFMAGVAGWNLRTGSGGSSYTQPQRYFHGGKSADVSPADSRCLSKDCHAAYPHGNGAVAPFRNMHVGFIDCLACHLGKKERGWRIVRDRKGTRWEIRSEETAGGNDPHAGLQSPWDCRDCHSGEGRKRLEAGGARDLPGGFHDPIALRMMEGGPRKWVPYDLR